MLDIDTCEGRALDEANAILSALGTLRQALEKHPGNASEQRRLLCQYTISLF